MFGLAALGVGRATRLVTTDTISERPRRWLLNREPRPGRMTKSPLGYVADGLLCNWCMSFWLAGVTFFLLERYTSLPLPGLWWPGLAWAGGWLAGRE